MEGSTLITPCLYKFASHRRMEKIHESRRPQVLIIDQDESFSVSGDSDLEYSDSEQMENDDSPLEVHEPNDLSSQRKSKGEV